MDKTIHLPLFYRLLIVFIDLFFIYGIIFSLSRRDDSTNFLLILSTFCLFLFSIYTLIIFIKYIFTENKIIVKIPLLLKKECVIEDIVGFAFINTSGESAINIYSSNGKITIRINGKKLKSEIKEFVEKNYEKIKLKNIQELQKKGINVQINKRIQYIFYENRFEVIENATIKRIYLYDKDVKKIMSGNSVIVIITNDNEKYKVTLYKAKGCIGLFEYLLNYKWDFE
ncbi:hypothetical protein [Breznakiella homolactica]|uniref:Uncharacterized protein n=1 Tax=Breznakiella homolactica TaxID=2798577 RepID=A0A7T7XQ05_9SPIR|nr:hypothetical protein [Breznakiella homolactica]QQO10375.1 hypothetical protein JFL75_05505 [Breznakiella homolactica]